MPKTEKNMELYDLEAQLQRDILGGGRVLRTERATTVAGMLYNAWCRIVQN
jgi:hypothetical protein